MNQEYICSELGCTNLVDFIFDELEKGYENGIYQGKIYIQAIQDELKGLDDDVKLMTIIKYLTVIKNEDLINNSNRFKHYFDESKKFKLTDVKGFKKELKNMAYYILKYFSCLYHSDVELINELKKFSEESYKYFISKYIYDNGVILLKELKLINGFDKLDCDYSNLSLGLLSRNQIQKIEFNSEIEKNIASNDSEVDDLSRDLRYLKTDLKRSEEQIELLKSTIDKYYFSSQTLIQDTFFGDNQPLVFELYNFLKNNNCLDYGWSYFYNCLVEGNIEIISLRNKQPNYFFGYLFWAISAFLKPPYTNDKKFFYNKFYIDQQPLKDSFFRNYYRSFKNEDYECIETIAKFIVKLKKIHNK
jgi:hypothetical protein